MARAQQCVVVQSACWKILEAPHLICRVSIEVVCALLLEFTFGFCGQRTFSGPSCNQAAFCGCVFNEWLCVAEVALWVLRFRCIRICPSEDQRECTSFYRGRQKIEETKRKRYSDITWSGGRARAWSRGHALTVHACVLENMRSHRTWQKHLIYKIPQCDHGKLRRTVENNVM